MVLLKEAEWLDHLGAVLIILEHMALRSFQNFDAQSNFDQIVFSNKFSRGTNKNSISIVALSSYN